MLRGNRPSTPTTTRVWTTHPPPIPVLARAPTTTAAPTSCRRAASRTRRLHPFRPASPQPPSQPSRSRSHGTPRLTTWASPATRSTAPARRWERLRQPPSPTAVWPVLRPTPIRSMRSTPPVTTRRSRPQSRSRPRSSRSRSFRAQANRPAAAIPASLSTWRSPWPRAIC